MICIIDSLRFPSFDFIILHQRIYITLRTDSNPPNRLQLEGLSQPRSALSAVYCTTFRLNNCRRRSRRREVWRVLPTEDKVGVLSVLRVIFILCYAHCTIIFSTNIEENGTHKKPKKYTRFFS